MFPSIDFFKIFSYIYVGSTLQVKLVEVTKYARLNLLSDWKRLQSFNFWFYAATQLFLSWFLFCFIMNVFYSCHRWTSSISWLFEIGVLWGKPRLLACLSRVQNIRVSRDSGAESSKNLWGVRQGWFSQTGKKTVELTWTWLADTTVCYLPKNACLGQSESLNCL